MEFICDWFLLICLKGTDKNFLVPVGGAIVASPQKQFIENLSSLYPGMIDWLNIQLGFECAEKCVFGND